MPKVGLVLPIPAIEGLKRQRSTYCQPKDRTERISPGSVEEAIQSIGQIFEVADESRKIHIKNSGKKISQMNN